VAEVEDVAGALGGLVENLFGAATDGFFVGQQDQRIEVALDGAVFADDVKIRGDKAGFVDDEAGAEALLIAVTAGVGDDDDRWAELSGEFSRGKNWIGGASI